MKSSKEQLKSRGYIEDEELENYRQYNKHQLLDLLHSKVPSERTISVRLLDKYNDKITLEALVDRLAIEDKLYPKIALSEAISNYGKDASILLVDYLGQIGSNQHKGLPEKPFNKKNYPLPRDIIARTMCKIGKPALNVLRESIYNGTYAQQLEAIDAIGFISYYESDDTLQDDIIELMNRYEEDNLMIWKLLRALQSFNNEKVIALLIKYKDSNVPQLRWEATRSMEQIERKQS
jgi:hypothetical protein